MLYTKQRPTSSGYISEQRSLPSWNFTGNQGKDSINKQPDKRIIEGVEYFNPEHVWGHSIPGRACNWGSTDRPNLRHTEVAGVFQGNDTVGRVGRENAER